MRREFSFYLHSVALLRLRTDHPLDVNSQGEIVADGGDFQNTPGVEREITGATAKNQKRLDGREDAFTDAVFSQHKVAYRASHVKRGR